MNILCICTTQYQVINCVNLLFSKHEKNNVDLLLLYSDKKVFDGINIEGLKNVFRIVNEYHIPSLYEAKYKRNLFLFKQIINKKPYGMNLNLKYNKILISGTEMHSKIVAMNYWQRDSKVEYIEDGLASYEAILKEDFKYRQDTILKRIFGKRALEVCECLYVYAPYLVTNNSYNKLVKKISTNKSKEYMQVINAIGMNKCRPFEKDFVFLDAWFQDINMYKEQIFYINILKDICSENYCVKIHPHEQKEEVSKKYYIEDCGNFEIANIEYDLSNKIYISIISTACLTPKLIANTNPRIIYLFDIFTQKYPVQEWNDAKKVIYNFIEKENYWNRIMIPKSIEEYKSILKKLIVER